MKKNNHIVVFPNSAVAKTNDTFRISNTEIDFFIDLKNKFYEVGLSGFSTNDDNFQDSLLPERVHLFLLGDLSEGKTIFLKIKKYLSVIPNLYKIPKKDTFFYVYLPHSWAYLVLFYLYILGYPFGIYLRGDWKRKGKIPSLLTKFFLNRARFILCTGLYLMKEVKLINEHAEEVIPMSKAIPKAVLYRDSYMLKGKINILYVGRVEYDKGIYELASAVKDLTEKGVNLEVKMAGSIKDLGYSEALIDYNISDKILLLDQISSKEQLDSLYKEADLFVFPSHHEGFPRVLYEAMAYGLPVISTNLPGIEAVLTHHKNVFLVQPKSYKNLSKAIQILIDDKQLRTSIGTNGSVFMANRIKKFKASSHCQQIVGFLKKNNPE